VNRSRYVQPFESIQPGETVDLWIPVSTPDRSKDLEAEEVEDWLRLAVENAGASVGRVETFTGSRYVGSLPIELRQAARRSKRDGRKLLAEWRDRFIRPPIDEDQERITRAALEELRAHTLGAELVTLVRPNATSKEVRANRTKRGHWAKGRKGGRPRTKYRPRFSEQDLVRVQRLRERGWSYARIAKRFNRSKSTIQGWVERTE
jgi:hypothetical protein